MSHGLPHRWLSHQQALQTGAPPPPLCSWMAMAATHHTHKQGQWCCEGQAVTTSLAHPSNSKGVLLTLSRAQAAEWRCLGTGAAVPLTAGRVHFIESVCRMLTSPTSWLLRRPLHWSKLAAVPWEIGCGTP